ncbi:MAG: aspartate aminotransferase family protein [Gemmatimonadota bacterium]|nr:aspartate aminotransferase family protein [Gemmatimonadota bacterium]
MTHILDDFERDMTPESASAFVQLVTEYLAATRDASQRVTSAHTPEELAARFAEPLPMGGRPIAQIVARLRDDVIAESNHLYHPRYVGHQVSAPLPAAVWTEPLVSALNQSVAVFEMSPVGTVLETQVIRWMCELAGLGAGAGGTLTSGGTEATQTALLAARAACRPDAWANGMGANPPVVVYGEHAHYAVSRAVGTLGLGVQNAVRVPSRDHRMDVQALRSTLDGLAEQKRDVMAVVATAGSTATGSFDDLEAIGALCESRGLWLHVDGAHGASALLSGRHRHRAAGLSRASSIAWDPHKMMLLPLSAGAVLVRDERALEAAFAQQAPYLFHGRGDREARRWDQGTRSAQCSRRADVFKLWVALQRYGADGIGALFDHLCDVTRAMYEDVARRPALEAMHEPECNILCFRWVGDGTLGGERLDAINRALRERYNASGHGWITATDLDGRRVLRVTIMNARTTVEHTREVLDELARLGGEIAAGR